MNQNAPFDENAAADALSAFQALDAWMGDGLIGRRDLVRRLLVSLLAGGHVLIEGPPGLAKTRAVKRLADGLDASFARIQCTPDLMPADLTGTLVFRPETGAFDFLAGPVFHAIVLVDEVNRAPPKVQSALLEAMGEGQVTVGGETRALPSPFMTVATQNPIEHEGTFPLPEAQLDRFLLHTLVGLPEAEEERRIIDLVEEEETGAEAEAPAPIPVDLIRAAKAAAARTYLAPALKDFIVRLVVATRDPSAGPDVAPHIEHAISPRGSLALASAARAAAWLDGRDHATPEDVAALAPDALSHRLVPTWRAAAEGETARGLIARLLSRVAPI